MNNGTITRITYALKKEYAFHFSIISFYKGIKLKSNYKKKGIERIYIT